MSFLDFFSPENIVYTMGFMAFGMLLGIILSGKVATFTDKDANGNLPTDVAKQFKNNFRHSFPWRSFYPKTDCIVHDYKKLRDYLNKIEKVYPNPSTKYTAGVALYLGKSFKENYAQESDGRMACVLKKNYTVFFLPVLYTEKPRNITCKDMMRNGVKVPGETEVTVMVIDKLCSPIEELDDTQLQRLDDICKNFIGHAIDLVNDPIGDAYDLGHTHP